MLLPLPCCQPFLPQQLVKRRLQIAQLSSARRRTPACRDSTRSQLQGMGKTWPQSPPDAADDCPIVKPIAGPLGIGVSSVYGEQQHWHRNVVEQISNMRLQILMSLARSNLTAAFVPAGLPTLQGFTLPRAAAVERRYKGIGENGVTGGGLCSSVAVPHPSFLLHHLLQTSAGCGFPVSCRIRLWTGETR